MIRHLIKFTLSICSFAGVLVFLLIKLEYNIPYIHIAVSQAWLPVLIIFKYVCIITAPVAITLLVYAAAKSMLNNNETLQIKRIQPAESKFLPTYIGLFVVAFELAGLELWPRTLLTALLFVFWIFLENTSYFNPFMLLVGFRFYEVESRAGVVYTVITKKKDVKQLAEFTQLIRLNNFVYLEETK